LITDERPATGHTATLRCGTVLVYESAGLVPGDGELVPCRHHGYCRVVRRRTGPGTGRAGARRTCRPRSRGELLAYLRDRPVTTLHALRRQRFTLRLVVQAEKDGIVAVDLLAGRVGLTARPAPVDALTGQPG